MTGATTFTGSAYFPGGAQGCHDKCQQDGMEMSGFVQSGEFATSCVCRPIQERRSDQAPGAEAEGEPDPSPRAAEDAANVSAAVGVVLQHRAQQQQQQQQRHY